MVVAVDVVEVAEAVVVGGLVVLDVPRPSERVVVELAPCPEQAARVAAMTSATSARELLVGFTRGPRVLDVIMQRSSGL
jgi:hypothetical protein